MSKRCIFHTKKSTKAEEILVCKALNQENAEEAARIAVTGAIHVRYSRYMIQVAKTLVERSVIGCLTR